MHTMTRLALFVLAIAVTGCSCSDERNTLTTSCSVHETRCGDDCVDTANDDLHCGGCNVACGQTETCVDARCVSTCGLEEVACAGRCVNLAKDPENCGACSTVCEGDQVCSKGSCSTDCDDGLVACEGSCVDLSSDPKHCGACGEYCGKSQVCIDSRCEMPCPAGMRECAGSCTDPQQDPSHCGACGNACKADELCVDGVCVADGDCPAGTECNGVCVDTDTDDDHCGACGFSCIDRPNTEGGHCDDGLCALHCIEFHQNCDGQIENGCEADLRSDLAHCGACHNDCTDGAHIAAAECIGGGCRLTCQAGWGDCGPLRGISCETNLNQDAAHCGACDNDCNDLPNVASTRCDEGSCEILSCQSGFANCNDDPGCETDTNTSKDHCGGCNQPCDGACEDGVCKGIKSILAGGRMTCALMADGSLYCWGENGNGQVGPGASRILKPQPIPGLGNALQVSMGDYHACAVISDGSVKCWGKNNFGQLGRGHTNPYNVANPTPEPVPGLTNAIAVSAGKQGHSCAILTPGEIWCWGYNGTGDLGDGTKNDSLVPVRAGTLSNAETLGLGWSHGCARLSDGGVACWGESGAKLKLGRWDDTSAPPAPVPNLSGVEEVTVGEQHSCARSGGQIRCWGNNSSDALGSDGWNMANWPPVMIPVTNVSTAKQMDAGSEHTCALLSSGEVVCWGHNGDGQLGAPAGGTRRTPVQVPGISNAKQVVAGGAHSCALLADDEIRCWGSNWQGQLGDGTTNDRHTPAPVVW